MLMFSSAPAAACTDERSERAPDVLADRDPDLHATDHVQLERIGVVTRREVARLVEHGVVRQQPLAIRADDLTVRTDGGGVVDVAILIDEPDDRGTPAGASGELRQHLEVVGDEPGLEHEVLGRVPGGRQLGERHDVAPGGIGTVVRVRQQREVAVEVAHGRVELGERDPQHRHDTRLPNRPAPPECSSVAVARRLIWHAGPLCVGEGCVGERSSSLVW